jgi:glycine betaine catabolism A
VNRTMIECTWAFAPEALEKPGFDPGYAVEFWDITNQQDWGACESVQRGLTSEHARPGPLSPDEDAVYQFVTMVARGYRGEPVWNPGAKAVAAS